MTAQKSGFSLQSTVLSVLTFHFHLLDLHRQLSIINDQHCHNSLWRFPWRCLEYQHSYFPGFMCVCVFECLCVLVLNLVITPLSYHTYIAIKGVQLIKILTIFVRCRSGKKSCSQLKSKLINC